jgi:hypothetical protein
MYRRAHMPSFRSVADDDDASAPFSPSHSSSHASSDTLDPLSPAGLSLSSPPLHSRARPARIAFTAPTVVDFSSAESSAESEQEEGGKEEEDDDVADDGPGGDDRDVGRVNRSVAARSHSRSLSLPGSRAATSSSFSSSSLPWLSPSSLSASPLVPSIALPLEAPFFQWRHTSRLVRPRIHHFQVCYWNNAFVLRK